MFRRRGTGTSLAGGWLAWNGMLTDIWRAARSLRRAPAFATIAILTIAIDFETMRFYPDRPPVFDIAGGMRQIVGIVRNVRHASLQTLPLPELYTPSLQRPVRDMTIVVRTAGDPLAHLPAVRESVRSIDPNQPVGGAGLLSNVVASSIARPRANFVLLSAFALVALALAMVGVYGLLSYMVAQRMPEIGIRLALGSAPGRVRSLILVEGLKLTGAGMMSGVAGALLASRTLRSLLAGVEAVDPLTLAGSVVVLGTVATVASYLPARRASAVDPIAALRPD